VKKAGRVHRPARPQRYEDFPIEQRRGAVREYAPVAFGGVMLILSFAFAGHYMGQNAIAHNAVPDEQLATIAAPASNIVAKGSLLPEGTNFDLVNATSVLTKQDVVEIGKGDIVEPKQPESTVVIVPAAVNLKQEAVEAAARKQAALALSPPKAKIENSFKLKRSEKQKAVAHRRVQLAEENCLARAVYFEARSESELGQLAVAKVILNRVKDPDYPNTICGVVYQGSGSRNSCQFSFACDGLPDDVRQPGAWSKSKVIAQKALAGDAKVAAISSATNYHADYVNPRWAKSMKRLIKIGRHIFYSDS
jgi:spore germination cell wall hydrolase CwlJ-like protein